MKKAFFDNLSLDKIPKWCIIAAEIFCALLAILIIFFNQSITVPDVTGISSEKAIKQLQKSGFKCETASEYSDDVLSNFVINQDIPAGTKLKRGSPVKITVSDGFTPITVPNLTGLTSAQAEEQLKQIGFTKISKTEVFSDKYTAGTVCVQSIESGKTAFRVSEITISVSKGPDLISVPNVTGKTVNSVKEELINAGFVPKTEIKCSDTVKENNIISQSLKSGSKVNRGSEIVLYVSAGKANKVGTTNSNAINRGDVTKQGDWIYFVNTRHDYYIYKMRADGSDKQIVVRDICATVNVLGEWIYYTVESSTDHGGLYKIRLDGTMKTKLDSNVFYYVFVDENYIYASRSSRGGMLYRINHDGSNKKTLIDDECSFANVDGDYIYFIGSDQKLYKMRNDGSMKTKISDNFAGSFLCLADGYLYAENMKNIEKISINGDGHYPYPVSEQASFLNYSDGWLYFLDHNFSKANQGEVHTAFARVRTDGSSKQTIYEFDFKNHANYFIAVIDEWIYFPNEYDNDCLYRINVTGGTPEKVY